MRHSFSWFPSCVTLGKTLDFSEPQFPSPKNVWKIVRRVFCGTWHTSIHWLHLATGVSWGKESLMWGDMVLPSFSPSASAFGSLWISWHLLAKQDFPLASPFFAGACWHLLPHPNLSYAAVQVQEAHWLKGTLYLFFFFFCLWLALATPDLRPPTLRSYSVQRNLHTSIYSGLGEERIARCGLTWVSHRWWLVATGIRMLSRWDSEVTRSRRGAHWDSLLTIQAITLGHRTPWWT